MARLYALALLSILASAASESLFDDEEVAAYKAKGEEGGEMPAGESLFDDDEVAAYNSRSDASEVDPAELAKEITFDSKEKKLNADIEFDERGNVKEGGNTDPSIAFWHVAELDGERFDEPTDGSSKLLEAIAQGADYVVKLAPPGLGGFQCTEKVDSMSKVLGEMSHEINEAIIERALGALAAEGIVNTKQLGELEEKDYDGIHLPALIKSRLRKNIAEAKKQAAVASKSVEMDSAEVQAELNAYMHARDASKGDASGTPDAAAAAAATSEQTPESEEEDGTFKSLVWAVMNCPTCKGKETIACFRTCRYGGELNKGEKKPWSDCLDQCIENRWLRATFYAMLPR